jgi:hypothetical protein
MSSCPACWNERGSCHGGTSPTPQCSLCRTSPSRRLLRLWLSAPKARLIKDCVAVGTSIISAIAIHNYDPSHGRGPDLALSDKEGGSLGKETASMLPLYFSRVARLAQAAVGDMLGQNETLERIIVMTPQPFAKHGNFTDTAAKSRIASILDSLHIPQLLEDPPPHLFLAACLFLAFAIGALQHSHKADVYLNRILVSGLIVGSAAAFQTTNVRMELKSYLAWSAILALLLSVFVHWALRLWRASHTLDNGSEITAQLHDKSCDKKNGLGDIVKKPPH